MRYAVVTAVIVAALGLGGLGGYVLHGQGTNQRDY
jgi:ABC-type proline/glycine betaine transport system permease subunit